MYHKIFDSSLMQHKGFGKHLDGAELKNGQDYPDMMATVGKALDGAKLTCGQDYANIVAIVNQKQMCIQVSFTILHRLNIA